MAGYFPIQPRQCRFCRRDFTPKRRVPVDDVCSNLECQYKRTQEKRQEQAREQSKTNPPKPVDPAKELAATKTALRKALDEAAKLRKENKRLHRIIMDMRQPIK